MKKMDNVKIREEILGLLKKIDRPGMDKLIAYLEKSDYFTAPASTRFHNAFEGGLAQHSLNVYYRLLSDVAEEQSYEKRMNQETDAVQKIGLDTIIICALLHDVCKVDFYEVSTRNVKDKKTGQWHEEPFYTIDDKLPYGHGEKSVYIISGFIKLTREEAFAIRFHMGEFSKDLNTSKAFGMFPLATMLHIADLQSTYLDEREV